MKNFILIQNDGEIELNSFELIGASTKRNSTGKIGFFGSGLKYSIAYMMRNNIEFHIFSGEKEIKFTTEVAKLRDDNFERICIDGKQTSYTTTMGPTWKEDWFVLREIYCNAIDESGVQLVKSTSDINASSGKTRIYIEVTENINAIIQNFESYFCDERVPFVHFDKVYTSALGTSDGLIIKGLKSNGDNKMSVYQKIHGILYRKGIRVYSHVEQLFDYNVEKCNINEDRTASAYDYLSYGVQDIFHRFLDEKYIYYVLKNGSTVEKPCLEFKWLRNGYPNREISPMWIAFSHKVCLIVHELSDRYESFIETSRKDVLFIPEHTAKLIKTQFPECQILGMNGIIGDISFSECESTPKIEYILKDCIAALKEMKYIIEYPVKIVSFNNERTLGKADPKANEIYLSNKLFNKGKREICLCLMEENEHILSNKGDETREFQNHIFSMWLKSMEESNGLFL